MESTEVKLKCDECGTRVVERGVWESTAEAVEYIRKGERVYCNTDDCYGQMQIVKDARVTTDSKPTNPKDLIGTNKVPLSLFPSTAVAAGSVAMLDGCLKYGRDNFRAIGVRASIYVDACERHLRAWMEGEDNAPDSGAPHLGHALACIAIIVDAQAAGKLEDDRKVRGGYAALLDSLTPTVAQLREKHADKSPHHYTINDEVSA